MALVRGIARPLLGAMFVFGGLDALTEPAGKVERAKTVTGQLPLDQDPETLIRINGAVQLAAGAFLSLGLLPRVSAAVLIGSLVPTTAAGHRFWEEEDTGNRATQQVHFLKNLAMLGGLLFAVTAPRNPSRHRDTAPGRDSKH